MSTSIATTDRAEIVPAQQQSSGSDLIQWAKQNGATTAEMKEFYQFQREIEADQARKAFTAARAAFGAEPVCIKKDKVNKQYDSRYSSMSSLVNTTRPYLSKYGLAASWEIDQTNGVTVTCVLTHVMGHSERVNAKFPLDTSGAKNALQQIKSSVTYGKILTYESVCGLASDEGNLDDDANGAVKDAKPRLTEEDFAQRIDLICEAQTVSDLQKVYIPANRAALAIDDKESARAFTNAKNKRYRELVPAKEEAAQ